MVVINDNNNNYEVSSKRMEFLPLVLKDFVNVFIVNFSLQCPQLVLQR